MPKKNNWFKKNEYIAQWISAIGVIGVVFFIIFLISGKPTAIVTKNNCNVEYLSGFKEALNNQCAKVSTDEWTDITENIRDYVNPQEGASLKLFISRKTPELCITNLYCSYEPSQINEAINIQTSVEVCITKAETNITTCEKSY